MTDFVVYNIKSTMLEQTFKHEGHARRNVAKRGAGYAFTDRKNYENNVVHMVERTNLMTGKKFYEPSNTPYYLSPASETYWSR